MTTRDLKIFFDNIRKPVFKGSMSRTQVSGIERLLDCWDTYGDGESVVAQEMLAYGLATSWWETGHRMQPVRETFALSDAQAIARLDNAFKAGKLGTVKTPYWRKGWFGRGDVQLTHEDNYKGAMREAVLSVFGVDIHADRDAVLRPDISAFILFEGIRAGITLKSDFTAHSLETFINESGVDFLNARKTVNPKDKKSYAPIAAVAESFLVALQRADIAEPVDVSDPVEYPDYAPAPVVVPTRPAPQPVEEFDVYNGEPHDVLRSVQKNLQRLLYPDVGNADGRWGTKTAGAILAFRRDNGLPLTDKIDDALLAALAKAAPRPLDPNRANATVEDIKQAPAVKDALTLDKLGKWAIAVGGILGVGQGVIKLEDIAGKIRTVNEIIEVAMPMLPWLALAGGGFFVYTKARKVVQDHLAGYRAGKSI